MIKSRVSNTPMDFITGYCFYVSEGVPVKSRANNTPMDFTDRILFCGSEGVASR